MLVMMNRTSFDYSKSHNFCNRHFARLNTSQVAMITTPKILTQKKGKEQCFLIQIWPFNSVVLAYFYA